MDNVYDYGYGSEDSRSEFWQGPSFLGPSLLWKKLNFDQIFIWAHWPCGAMDNESDHESEDSRSDSWQGRLAFISAQKSLTLFQ